MPKMDGTGHDGKGKGTGRKLGQCTTSVALLRTNENWLNWAKGWAKSEIPVRMRTVENR